MPVSSSLPPSPTSEAQGAAPKCLAEGAEVELDGIVTTLHREVYGEMRSAHILNVEDPVCVMVDMGGEQTGENAPEMISRFHLTNLSRPPEGVKYDEAAFKRVTIVGRVMTGNYSQSYTEPNAIDVESIRIQ